MVLMCIKAPRRASERVESNHEPGRRAKHQAGESKTQTDAKRPPRAERDPWSGQRSRFGTGRCRAGADAFMTRC